MVPTCAATVLRVPASPRLLAHLRPRRRRLAHLRVVAGVRAAMGTGVRAAMQIRTIPGTHTPTDIRMAMLIRTPTRRRMLRCARCSSCWASLAQFSLQS